MNDRAVNVVVGNEPWPSESIEKLGKCTACGSSDRKALFSDLEDIVFKCAPGKWELQSCGKCNSAYLDPRPDEASIGQAYEVYYTHSDNSESSVVGKFKRNRLFEAAYNGRLNQKYKLKRNPASAFLGSLLRMVPFVGHFFDPYARSVPLPPKAGAKLLDFGCGDGRFMEFAKEVGWDCKGIDFDPECVKVAKQRGLNVIAGGMDELHQERGYDFITLCHVIEHVHDPRDTVTACLNALNPGGVLWMETPNINSYGHSRFGEFWRGLECPRHLTIFTPESLAGLMENCGFSNVSNHPRLFVNLGTYAASASLREGKGNEKKTLESILKLAPFLDGLKTVFRRNKSEFIQISGQKPG